MTNRVSVRLDVKCCLFWIVCNYLNIFMTSNAHYYHMAYMPLVSVSVGIPTLTPTKVFT